MKHYQLPKIGLRTLKTSLAVFICLLIFPKEPFFACMTAVFCIQDTLVNSFKMAITRGYGTFHGGMLGLCFLLFCKIIDHAVANTYLNHILINIVIALGIIAVIYSCTLIDRHTSIPIACIVFLGVTTVHAYTDPFYYAFHRTLKTLGGLAIAIIINKYVTPPETTK